jgi:4-amino-4-deoxy-L-arabinose transferase-like glycosyltransferase
VTRLRQFLERPALPAWIFVIIAFLARLAGVLALFDNVAYFADERMYLRIADLVAGGQWLAEGTILAPVPIYFQGILKALGLDLFGIRVVQALVGAGAVGLYFLIGRRIFGPIVAGAAALVMAGYPYLVYLAGIFYPQAIFVFTLALTLYALLRWIQAPPGASSPGWLVTAGLSLGLSALTVIPILSAAPLLALWLLMAGRGSLRRRFGAVFVLAGLSVLVILPWTVRNAVVAKQFILISAMGPQAFYWANNAAIDPYDRDPEAWLLQYQKRLNVEMARQGMDPAEMNRHLSYRANRFLKVHSGRALRNYLIRLSFFFDAAPRSFTSNEHTRSRKTEMVAVISSLPILLLAPLGVWFSRRRWRLWFPLAAVPLAQAISYAAFHVSVRYRFPFEPCFILFAVVGVCGVIWPEALHPERVPAGETSPVLHGGNPQSERLRLSPRDEQGTEGDRLPG